MKLLCKFWHRWQDRGANRYGTVTYQVCLRCRKAQCRKNKINEPDRFEECERVKELDDQFDKNDRLIMPHEIDELNK